MYIRGNIKTKHYNTMRDGVYEEGDTLQLENGKTLIAVPSDTDGSGCHVCDDGVHKCYFLEHNSVPGFSQVCPKCHSDKFVFMDYIGGRVIFLEKEEE